ncbi:ArsR/SmtB family transcription factor [Robiginitomaculum antarcticum]|uniref:ArsR/SmtB family transcription factor n=1 Tax=Robiginitomaculum antarcticum TaxID=437507 RepID=UPI000527D768|nr:helix-turn-helix domain-containing protein [Robiginitomaculum antarcticum]
MNDDLAVKCLSAMGHMGRINLIRHLIQAGPQGLSAGRLAELGSVGAPTASAQLLVLSTAGLVASRREGRHIIYHAEFGQLAAVMTYLMQDCCGGKIAVPQLVT